MVKHNEGQERIPSFFVAVNIVINYLLYNIKGVTGGTDQTSGECSLGQTIPI